MGWQMLTCSDRYELSQMGAKIAGDKPYVIWNGVIPEVVLTQAEHVKQFYSKASQGTFLFFRRKMFVTRARAQN